MTEQKTVDLFGVPDVLIAPDAVVQKRAARQPRTKKSENQAKSLGGQAAGSKPNSPSAAANLPGQGFLPGLSRRGRPRLAKPISAVERTAEHRRKRIANGAKRVEIILDSDVSQALDRLAEHHQEPKSDVIAALIRKAATRLKG
ncbi:MAG: hypothetical protein NBV66_10390 [Burkholderiaceae bacterium]|nr:hypothetical protein [Burkholderiaceae bacterium]